MKKLALLVCILAFVQNGVAKAGMDSGVKWDLSQKS